MVNKDDEKVVSTNNEEVFTPVVYGNFPNKEIYDFLNNISNSVGQTINEYHWREVCNLMKIMEDEKLVEIEFSKNKKG